MSSCPKMASALSTLTSRRCRWNVSGSCFLRLRLKIRKLKILSLLRTGKKNHHLFIMSSYLLFVLFRLERYYDFIPFQIGSIKTQPLKWSSPCFSDLSFALTFNDTAALVSIQAAGKTNAVCSELYSFCDRESCHFKPLDVPGHHTVQFELAQYEYTDITRNGLGTYLWPLGIEGTTESLRKTLSLFSGEDMVQNNIDFFAQKELWAVNPRPYNFLNLSVDNFHSGDMLTVLRLDGVDPLIGILSSTNFFFHSFEFSHLFLFLLYLLCFVDLHISMGNWRNDWSYNNLHGVL